MLLKKKSTEGALLILSKSAFRMQNTSVNRITLGLAYSIIVCLYVLSFQQDKKVDSNFSFLDI
jgi:hypothetical protein